MAKFCICAILHSDQELDAPAWAVPCFLVRNVLACVSWYRQTSRSRVPVGYITYLTCVNGTLVATTGTTWAVSADPPARSPFV